MRGMLSPFLARADPLKFFSLTLEVGTPRMPPLLPPAPLALSPSTLSPSSSSHPPQPPQSEIEATLNRIGSYKVRTPFMSCAVLSSFFSPLCLPRLRPPLPLCFCSHRSFFIVSRTTIRRESGRSSSWGKMGRSCGLTRRYVGHKLAPSSIHSLFLPHSSSSCP
jgi:hypothetical protein